MTQTSNDQLPKHNWSSYQKEIFKEIGRGDQNCIVIARAGASKTTVLVEGAKYIPRGKKAIFCAFNKSIQLTLKDKLPKYINCSTVHSLGFQAVRARFGKVDLDKDKCFDIVKKMVGDEREKFDLICNICDAVSLCKSRLVDIPEQIDELIAEFDIDLCDITPKAFINYVSQALRRCKEKTDIVDYDDMVWFCFVYRLRPTLVDIVFIDECQDLTRGQLELALSAVKIDGRVIAVLDDRQVLYAFAGVDLNVLENLRARLKPKELMLPICYRCPKDVVKLAQRYVPDIQHYENAIDGKVHHIDINELFDKVSGGCFVLSRFNAPLVPLCMKMIRAGIKSNIYGRDIGDGLQYLINKSKKKTLPKFIEWLTTWEKNEKAKMLAKNPRAKTEVISDKAECLFNLCSDCETIEDVKKNIDKMFKDSNDQDVVWLSTVHKRKGAETNIVFILADTLRYNDLSENNINYVALTRCKEELYFVSKNNINKTSVFGNNSESISYGNMVHFSNTIDDIGNKHYKDDGMINEIVVESMAGDEEERIYPYENGGVNDWCD